MFGRSVPEFVASPEAHAEAAGTFEILVRAVAAAQAAGELGGGEPGQVALALWAVGHGLVMIELAGIAPEIRGADPDRTYRLAVDAMLAGLAGMAAPAGGRPRSRSDPPQE
jgi:AcrR family transcriptional regulator